MNSKIKIASDKYEEYKEDWGDMMGSKIVPVGYRGRQIFPDKTNPDNLSDAQDDIREYYGLSNCYGISEDDK